MLATSVSGSATDYTRTVDGYTGFSINTYDSNPSNYNIFIGHSVKTKINNSKAFINTTSKRDEIKLNLSDMTFVKVGNSKKFQHFKDVFKLLIGDLFFRIPDQNLRNIIKKTYKL